MLVSHLNNASLRYFFTSTTPPPSGQLCLELCKLTHLPSVPSPSQQPCPAQNLFPWLCLFKVSIWTLYHGAGFVHSVEDRALTHRHTPCWCWHLCYGWTDHRLLIEERQLYQIQTQKKPNYPSYLLQTPKPVPKAQATPAQTPPRENHPGLVGSDLFQKQPSTSPAPRARWRTALPCLSRSPGG